MDSTNNFSEIEEPKTTSFFSASKLVLFIVVIGVIAAIAYIIYIIWNAITNNPLVNIVGETLGTMGKILLGIDNLLNGCKDGIESCSWGIAIFGIIFLYMGYWVWKTFRMTSKSKDVVKLQELTGMSDENIFKTAKTLYQQYKDDLEQSKKKLMEEKSRSGLTEEELIKIDKSIKLIDEFLENERNIQKMKKTNPGLYEYHQKIIRMLFLTDADIKLQKSYETDKSVSSDKLRKAIETNNLERMKVKSDIAKFREQIRKNNFDPDSFETKFDEINEERIKTSNTRNSQTGRSAQIDIDTHRIRPIK